MTRIFTRTLLVIAIWALFLAQSSAPAHSQTSPTVAEPPVMVVVDTSGSMAETGSDGRIKIEAAGEALASMMETTPGSTRVGIWTYPAQGGCDGGVLSTPVQPVAGLNAESVADSWTAEGDTPTALALRAAAEEIRRQQGRSIILISDGESRCSADPCAVAQDLVAEGFEIQVHTVGLAISDAGREELLCIADATGGTYADALDAPQLDEILRNLAEVSMSVSAKSRVEAAAGTPDRALSVVDATVANDGVVSARDIDVTFRFTGNERVALLDATRRFPIVAPNTPNSVTWRFEVPSGCEAYDLEYEILVRRGGILEAQTSGTIDVPAGAQDTIACLLVTGNVAILGDSYSSGEGAPEYDAGTNEKYNRCRRGQTYGRADRAADGLTVLACSGAIIHDLLLPQGEYQMTRGGSLLPSQLKQLEGVGEEVDVVVLTVSGNDISFAEIVKGCVLDYGRGCVDPPDARIVSAETGIRSVATALARALRILESTVNSGRDRPIQFILMPYVELLPRDGFPEEADDCPLGWNWMQLEIDTTEAEYLADLQNDVNAALRATALQLRSEGRPVHFAQSVSGAFAGHTVCDTEPWGHGVKLRDQRTSVHPNNEGYRAVWSVLLADARGWQVMDRAVSAESSVDNGQLCPVNDSRNVYSLSDFLDGSGLEMVRGECIVVVGKADGSGPPSDLDGAEGNAGLRSWIAFYIQSDPELLGVAYPNDDGEFRELLWIPDDLPAGTHTLSAIAADSSGGLDVIHVPVRIVEERTSPYKIAMLLAFGVLLLGLGLIALNPKRS